MLALLLNLGFAGSGATASADSRVIASGLTRLAPRFAMQNVQPEFSMTNRAPRFPLSRIEVEE
jgi:hypothetical protein